MPNLSMNHLLIPVHINQDIKRRQNKDNDSTVHTTEYQSKKKPTRINNFKKASISLQPADRQDIKYIVNIVFQFQSTMYSQKPIRDLFISVGCRLR